MRVVRLVQMQVAVGVALKDVAADDEVLTERSRLRRCQRCGSLHGVASCAVARRPDALTLVVADFHTAQYKGTGVDGHAIALAMCAFAALGTRVEDCAPAIDNCGLESGWVHILSNSEEAAQMPATET